MQGESREAKKDMVYVDADGHQKHVKDANAKLQEREKKGIAVGKTMRCISGTHSDMLCTVLAIEPKVILFKQQPVCLSYRYITLTRAFIR